MFLNARFAVTNTECLHWMLVKHLFALFTIVFVLSEVLFVQVTMPSKDRARRNKKKEINKLYYQSNKEDILSDRKESYDKYKRCERHKDDYYRDLMALRLISANCNTIRMWTRPELNQLRVQK